MNYKTCLATVSFKNWLESLLLPKIVGKRWKRNPHGASLNTFDVLGQIGW